MNLLTRSYLIGLIALFFLWRPLGWLVHWDLWDGFRRPWLFWWWFTMLPMPDWPARYGPGNGPGECSGPFLIGVLLGLVGVCASLSLVAVIVIWLTRGAWPWEKKDADNALEAKRNQDVRGEEKQ